MKHKMKTLLAFTIDEDAKARKIKFNNSWAHFQSYMTTLIEHKQSTEIVALDEDELT